MSINVSEMSRVDMIQFLVQMTRAVRKSLKEDERMLTEMLGPDPRETEEVQSIEMSKSTEMSKMKSELIVDEHKDDDEGYPDETECKYSFEECPQCQRTKDALLEFQRMIDSDEYAANDGNLGSLQRESRDRMLCNIFNDQYDVVDLLNDFHHLREAHSIDDDGNPIQFESCYDFVTGAKPSIQCHGTDCRALRRQYRRRRGDDDTESEDYRHTILLQIHCYLVHSMDLNKLTRKERMDVEADSISDPEQRQEKIAQIIRSKSQKFSDLVVDANNNKFSSKGDNEKSMGDAGSDVGDSSVPLIRRSSVVSTKQQKYEYLERDDAQILEEFQRITGCIEDVAVSFLRDSEWNSAIALHRFYDGEMMQNVEEIGNGKESMHRVDDSNQRNDEVYTNGVRFWYWNDDSRPRNAVTVRPKYKNLKEEMLIPGHFKTSIWNDLVTVCEALLKVQWVKKMIASGIGSKIYGIRARTAFALPWLLALKLYTDFNDLNHTFCDQFRLNVFGNREETISSIRKRNGRYFNMAKQLTECVQCFGQMLVAKKKRYYRGVNRAFVFPRFISRFHVPLSTSKSV